MLLFHVFICQIKMVYFSFFQYLNNVSSWLSMCEKVNVPGDIPGLEDAIHEHQSLIDNITQAYTEVLHHICYIYKI